MGPTKLHVHPIFEIGPLQPHYSGENNPNDHTLRTCQAHFVPELLKLEAHEPQICTMCQSAFLMFAQACQQQVLFLRLLCWPPKIQRVWRTRYLQLQSLITSVAIAGSHLHAEWLVFEGISVDESGRQHYLDATVAYKRAVLNCIHYLAKFGFTKEQVCID